VTLTYTLFDFGQRTSQAIAAREALYMADWSHNQQIQAIIQIVMNDYYDYIYQMKVQRSIEANLEIAKISLDAANQRFALGLAALGDVAQARTQFLQSKINLTNQRQNVENSFAELATDLGLPANVAFKVQPMPDEIESAPCLESVDQLVAIAQNQRPDLRAANANIRSKESLLLNARRAVYPVVATNFDIGKYWFDHGQHEHKAHWTAEVTISFPLFQGFFYKNGIKKAEANLENSRAQFIQTELSIIQTVTTSHMNVKTAALNLKDTDEYLKAAEMEYNISLSGYKAGTATILDVLSAQSSLADARAKKAGAQKAWYSSLAAIAYATGCLCTQANGECSI
jgi:outer membrane protein TolC